MIIWEDHTPSIKIYLHNVDTGGENQNIINVSINTNGSTIRLIKSLTFFLFSSKSAIRLSLAEWKGLDAISDRM